MRRNLPVLQRSPKLTSLTQKSPVTKVSIKPKLNNTQTSLRLCRDAHNNSNNNNNNSSNISSNNNNNNNNDDDDDDDYDDVDNDDNK